MQEAWSVHGVYPGFDWMPDGKSIVVWAQGQLWRVDIASKAATIIPFHVQSTRELRDSVRFAQDVAPAQFDVKQLRWVNVSPDGKKVVYSALGHLFVKNLPDGEPKRLTKQTEHFEFYPNWSRDGKSLTYVSWHDKNLDAVHVIKADGSGDKVLTDKPGKYLEPRFSPDGKTVVYNKLAGGYLTSPWWSADTGIYRVESSGKSVPEQLTKDGSQPQFGARNDELFFVRFDYKDPDFSSKLIRLDLAKRVEREIAESEYASEYTLAPNGQFISFAERNHVYVMPLPASSKVLAAGKDGEQMPVQKLSLNSGEYVHFSADSTKLYYALGNQLFSRELKDTFSYLPGASTEPTKPGAAGIAIGFTQKADVTNATTLISGARIVTMRGDEVLNNGQILIEGNRIKAIGKDLNVPSNVTRIDASGKTIIPGLVDVHWHGGMGEDQLIPQTSWINLASLSFGVTTIHDPSNDTHEILTQAEMQKAGMVTGPRIFSTGTILYGAKAPYTASVNSLAEALTHLERQKANGAISIKSYNQPRREQRQQVLEAARQTGMLDVPEGGSLFHHNMNMIIDGHTGVEHSIPVAKAYDDVLQLWSQSKVGYTPTFGVGYGGLDGEHYWYAKTNVWEHPILSKYVPRTVLDARSRRREIAPDNEWNILNNARLATELLRAGVSVNLGAHGQREGLAAHWEMWTLALGGATPLEAIRFGTLNGARYLGMDKDIGSLEVGKLADLMIIDGDILADIRQSDKVSQVMVNGRLYDTATMNEIGATPKTRAPLFFEGNDSAYVPGTGAVWSRGHGHQDGD